MKREFNKARYIELLSELCALSMCSENDYDEYTRLVGEVNKLIASADLLTPEKEEILKLIMALIREYEFFYIYKQNKK